MTEKGNVSPHDPQSVYAKSLSDCRKRYGYPLLSPGPSSTLTDSYQKEGLKIGDVGHIDRDGIFYVHCNIRCDSGDTINRNRLPSDFKYVRLDERFDIEVRPNAISSPYIVKSQHITQEQTNDPRASHVFRSSESSGAILILPSGARFENLVAPKSFRRIAEQHGYEWCMNTEQRSVYLITGLYKVRSWSRGCFDRPPGRIEATPDGSKSPPQKYIWTTEQGTIHSEGHTEESSHNQTVFIRGFRVTKKDPSGQKDRSCSSLWSLVMNCLCRNKIVEVQHEPRFTSPLDISDEINRRLLEKHPTADVAIIHDDEWTHILDEGGLSCDDSTQVDHLVEHLLEKSDILVEHGCGVASLRETVCHSPPLNGCPFSTVLVIKTIRVDNVFSGLRRTPFGFYVHIDPLKWNTKTRFGTVDSPVIEWVEDIEIPLLSPTEKVKFSICVVFGSNPTLGGWEILHTVEIDAKDLAKATCYKKAQSLAPALFLTLTERPTDRLRTGSCHESDRSYKNPSPTTADRTNLGNDALVRYYHEYKTEDIMESIEHFCCSLLALSCEDYYYAPAVFNLATAQLNRCLLHGTYTDFDQSVILSYKEVLDILPVSHLDRPSALLHLAQALLYRYGKHGYEEHSDLNIVTLTKEVERTCSINSHERQAMNLIHQTYQRYRLVRSGDLHNLEALLGEFDMAVRVCPEGYFDRPHRLINLGVALHIHSRHHNDCINKSVVVHEEALRLTPLRHPDRVAFLISLGAALLTRFRLRSNPGDLSDLNESIRIIAEAEQLVPDGHVDRATCLHAFGVALLQRFEQSSDLADINRSVSLIDEALGLIRSEHLDKALYLHSLCMALLRRFDVRNDLGDLRDINRSILLGDEASRVVSNEHPNKATYLHFFSVALLRRFDICHNLSDFDRHIAALEEILQLVPSNSGIAFHVHFQHYSDCINKSAAVHEEALWLIPPWHPANIVAFSISLSIALLTRFRLRSNPGDLNESIRIITEAEQLVPDGHVDRATCLYTFGAALLQRFEQSSDPADINRSVSLIDEALGLIRSEHSDKALYFHSLCMVLLRRFDARTDFGDLTDIDRSILLGDEALRLVSNEHPKKATYLHSFSVALLRRFDTSHDLSDLDRHIAVLEEILQLAPSNLGTALHVHSRHYHDCINKSATVHEEILCSISPRHPNRVTFLIGLSTALFTRFRLRSNPGDLSDLSKSIRIITEAEQLVPNGHVDRATCLHTFGIALLQRFEQSSDLADINRSVSLIDEALGLIRSEHLDKALYLHSLCMALLRRFDVRNDLGDLSDINRSISLGGEASRLVPDEHPDKVTYLHSFSAALLRRVDISRDLSDLDRYITVLEDILQLIPSVHSERVAYLDSLDAARRRRSDLYADSMYLNRKALPVPTTRHEIRGTDNPPTYEAQRRLFPNVLIVGETGVGKSSVVNLIAGEDIARVSSGAGSCTMDAVSYDIILPDGQGLSHHIRLFDTVGLNEPWFGRSHYLTMIEKANTLIHQLQHTGGIRLLVFCIRGGRVTAVMQNNYRLFCDILCQNQVPVAFVITGLENEPSMEGWWERHVGLFEKYGLSCASHACITAIRGLNNCYERKYADSQTTIRAMLLAHVTGDGASWRPERMEWFIYLASRLLKWLSQTRNRSRRVLTQQELTRHLQDKCKFSRTEAASLAGKIFEERQENEGPNLVKSDDTSSIDSL